MTPSIATHLGRMFLIGGIVILVLDNGHALLRLAGIVSVSAAIALTTWAQWQEMGGDQ